MIVTLCITGGRTDFCNCNATGCPEACTSVIHIGKGFVHSDFRLNNIEKSEKPKKNYHKFLPKKNKRWNK